MLEALWVVRQFSKQIRRDLHRFHGLKLADWWRGKRDQAGQLVLSSGELLDYLEFMDDEGAFKTALRGGRWPDWKQMLAETTNEAYRLRASYHAAHSTPDVDARFDPEPLYFIGPGLREAYEAVAEQEAQAAVDFNAEIGFS